MTTVNETLLMNALNDEISRLRLAVGTLRAECWDHLWDGLEMNRDDYDLETQKLQYGGVV